MKKKIGSVKAAGSAMAKMSIAEEPEDG